MSSRNRRISNSSSSEDGEEGQNNGNGREQQPGGGSRRDENSISFRHFLQPQSDVVPTRHTRPTSSSGRSHSTAPIDLVDASIVLPDFVQDHLVMEAQACGDSSSNEAHLIPNNAVSPLDLGLINELMPNLLDSTSRSTVAEPAPEPEELGAYGPPPTGTASLPDFLSDGPMHFNTSASDLSEASSRFVTPRSCTTSLGRSIRGSSHSQESLFQYIQRLERELQDRDKRILELENIILDQKAELVGLYELMQQQKEASGNGERMVRLPLDAQAEGTAENAESLLNHRPSVTTNRTSVEAIATRAESLLEDLMKEIRKLKRND